MGEEISLIERYLDIYRKGENLEPIVEALDRENEYRFKIPAIIEFSVTESDIEEIYSFENFKNDVNKGITQNGMRSIIVNGIQQYAEDKLRDLHLNSKGFNIVSKSKPELIKAKQYGLKIGAMLSKYRHQLDLIEKEEKDKLGKNVVGLNNSVLNPLDVN